MNLLIEKIIGRLIDFIFIYMNNKRTTKEEQTPIYDQILCNGSFIYDPVCKMHENLWHFTGGLGDKADFSYWPPFLQPDRHPISLIFLLVEYNDGYSSICFMTIRTQLRLSNLLKAAFLSHIQPNNKWDISTLNRPVQWVLIQQHH